MLNLLNQVTKFWNSTSYELNTAMAVSFSKGRQNYLYPICRAKYIRTSSWLKYLAHPCYKNLSNSRMAKQGSQETINNNQSPEHANKPKREIRVLLHCYWVEWPGVVEIQLVKGKKSCTFILSQSDPCIHKVVWEKWTEMWQISLPYNALSRHDEQRCSTSLKVSFTCCIDKKGEPHSLAEYRAF